MQVRHAVTERENRRNVEQRVADDDRERTLQQRQPMRPHHFEERNRDPFSARHRRAKGGRLADRYPDVEPDRHQHGAQQEWYSPGPGDKIRLAEAEQQHQE